MQVYKAIARLNWPRTYVGKLVLVCFSAVMAPLGLLLVACMATDRVNAQALVAFAALAGVAGTMLALVLMHQMLAPMRATWDALEMYIQHGRLPDLPTSYPDEAGRLMAQVQHTIRALDIASKELRRLASLDPLTALHNRRWLIQRGQDEVVRARRENRPLSAILMDLDHFKTINDLHGHGAGDAALIAVAEVMRNALRPYDLLARLGGEEFCLVMPDTDIVVASAVAERLRRAIAEQTIPQVPGSGITASLGVVTLSADDGGFLAFIGRADAMLYGAKRTGRNRVMVAA